jgi:hypothetical protein
MLKGDANVECFHDDEGEVPIQEGVQFDNLFGGSGNY